MAVDDSDTSEVVAVSVRDPSEAPLLRGQHFVSPWFRMDPDRSELFERASYLDLSPHPFGGEAGYGDDLVEGFHLVAMLDHLVNHVLWSEGPCLGWNYGLDRVRFVTPIRFSDRFRVRGTVTDVIDRGEQGHLLVLDYIGEVDGRARPGFVATHRVLWTTHQAD
ncbi:acyl dehydratase [Kibdelosporangium banguiense]|uniref:Acyl dehydratase n=1 Tax=Kibdelosporangium banguiense TaxID=1365924 RepID=A0ABS4TPX6_9PSEU|nr:MaoC/PaaZ C-terminal domain-containing protein [Kibdelosporangium banguiense]MBP2326459.1 acyl dehydratase [Kibdelosporangium banguiense]